MKVEPQRWCSRSGWHPRLRRLQWWFDGSALLPFSSPSPLLPPSSLLSISVGVGEASSGGGVDGMG